MDKEQIKQQLDSMVTNTTPSLVPTFTGSFDDVIMGCKSVYQKYAKMTDHQAIVLALWTVHTWTMPTGASHTPYMNITSGTPRAGKTRVVEIANILCKNPLFSHNASAAVIGRTSYGHTILIDEADKQMKNPDMKESLNAILNSGFEESGSYARMGGNNMTQVDNFQTFSAKIISGIAQFHMADTLIDRSIKLTMMRKKKSEVFPRFKKPLVKKEVAELRQKLTEISLDEDLLQRLYFAEPKLPDELDDRKKDITEPLFAIAELASKKILDLFCAAIINLCVNQTPDLTMAEQLLIDMSKIMNGKSIHTKDLVDELNRPDSDFSWSGNNQGFGIKDYQVASLLKPFGIIPKVISIGGEKLRGYQFTPHLEEVFALHSEDDVTDVTPLPSDTEQTQEVSRNLEVTEPLPEETSAVPVTLDVTLIEPKVTPVTGVTPLEGIHKEVTLFEAKYGKDNMPEGFVYNPEDNRSIERQISIYNFEKNQTADSSDDEEMERIF